MVNIWAPTHVRPFYPNAVKSSYYIELFLLYARIRHNATEDKVAFLTSICSDDLNSVGMPKTKMIGPFNQGGLDGYPFAGETGIGAFAHHIPDKGVALMFFGPHVGITNKKQVGQVVRPGQKDPSSCCGAAAAALAALEKGEIEKLEPPCYPVNDYQQERIRQTVLENKKVIEAAGGTGSPERFIAMSKAIYLKTKEAFLDQIGVTTFHRPAYFFGGTLINQDGHKKSLIDLEDVGVVEHGKYKDLTSDFNTLATKRFDAFRAGDKYAFKHL